MHMCYLLVISLCNLPLSCNFVINSKYVNQKRKSIKKKHYFCIMITDQSYLQFYSCMFSIKSHRYLCHDFMSSFIIIMDAFHYLLLLHSIQFMLSGQCSHLRCHVGMNFISITVQSCVNKTASKVP